MTLYIDTTDFNRVMFAVSFFPPPPGGRVGRGVVIKKKFYKIDSHKSHETLARLGEFLKSVKIKPSPRPSPRGGGGENKIKKIVVNKGPGSYTGVRVGVAHAMALGFAWGIKVSALPAADFTRMITLNKR